MTIGQWIIPAIVLIAMTKNSQCRLCTHAAHGAGQDALGRELFRCPRCGYVYVSKTHFLKADAEESRYLKHKNSIDDVDYVAFLRRLLDPLEAHLRHGDLVLDYGSGPNPVFSELLEQSGYYAYIYDRFFAPILPEDTYDAITATEVFEHFQNPQKEIATILSLLEKRGILGIMTERYSDKTTFKTWYYTKDPTHVGFFSDTTFKWLEKKYDLERVYDDGERVIILQRR